MPVAKTKRTRVEGGRSYSRVTWQELSRHHTYWQTRPQALPHQNTHILSAENQESRKLSAESQKAEKLSSPETPNLQNMKLKTEINHKITHLQPGHQNTKTDPASKKGQMVTGIQKKGPLVKRETQLIVQTRMEQGNKKLHPHTPIQEAPKTSDAAVPTKLRSPVSAVVNTQPTHGVPKTSHVVPTNKLRSPVSPKEDGTEGRSKTNQQFESLDNKTHHSIVPQNNKPALHNNNKVVAQNGKVSTFHNNIKPVPQSSKSVTHNNHSQPLSPESRSAHVSHQHRQNPCIHQNNSNNHPQSAIQPVRNQAIHKTQPCTASRSTIHPSATHSTQSRYTHTQSILSHATTQHSHAHQQQQSLARSSTHTTNTHLAYTHAQNLSRSSTTHINTQITNSHHNQQQHHTYSNSTTHYHQHQHKHTYSNTITHQHHHHRQQQSVQPRPSSTTSSASSSSSSCPPTNKTHSPSPPPPRRLDPGSSRQSEWGIRTLKMRRVRLRDRFALYPLSSPERHPEDLTHDRRGDKSPNTSQEMETPKLVGTSANGVSSDLLEGGASSDSSDNWVFENGIPKADATQNGVPEIGMSGNGVPVSEIGTTGIPSKFEVYDVSDGRSDGNVSEDTGDSGDDKHRRRGNDGSEVCAGEEDSDDGGGGSGSSDGNDEGCVCDSDDDLSRSDAVSGSDYEAVIDDTGDVATSCDKYGSNSDIDAKESERDSCSDQDTNSGFSPIKYEVTFADLNWTSGDEDDDDYSDDPFSGVDTLSAEEMDDMMNSETFLSSGISHLSEADTNHINGSEEFVCSETNQLRESISFASNEANPLRGSETFVSSNTNCLRGSETFVSSDRNVMSGEAFGSKESSSSTSSSDEESGCLWVSGVGMSLGEAGNSVVRSALVVPTVKALTQLQPVDNDTYSSLNSVTQASPNNATHSPCKVGKPSQYPSSKEDENGWSEGIVPYSPTRSTSATRILSEEVVESGINQSPGSGREDENGRAGGDKDGGGDEDLSEGGFENEKKSEGGGRGGDKGKGGVDGGEAVEGGGRVVRQATFTLPASDTSLHDLIHDNSHTHVQPPSHLPAPPPAPHLPTPRPSSTSASHHPTPRSAHPQHTTPRSPQQRTTRPAVEKGTSLDAPTSRSTPARSPPVTSRPGKGCGGRVEATRAEPLKTSKGARGGNSNNNNNNNSSSGSKRGATTLSSGTSSDDACRSKQQREETQPRGRTLKISLKDDPTRRASGLSTPVSRTRSGSRGSGGASPATLSNRVSHKTATVAPAPSRPSTKALNRFGFRTNGKKATAAVKSGESTDSVNSILSDAQTNSDSNSNIFELCDEDEKNSNGSIDKICDSNGKSSELISNDNALKTARLESPLVRQSKPVTTASGSVKPGSTISQQSGRITAHTRQLPKPQIVTVKSFSPKALTQSPRHPSPAISKSRSPSATPTPRDPTASPSVRSLVQTPAKTSMDQVSRVRQQVPGSSQSIPRISRDSESSTKSVLEADSGIGSSSESDRIRGEAAETDTIASSTIESTEDMSDAWLRAKQASQDSAVRRSKNFELNINGTEFEIKSQGQDMKELTSLNCDSSNISLKSGSPSEKRVKVGKEKRETPITYSMARQKFAPYNRNRYGYGYQSGVGRSNSSDSTQNSSTSTATSTTQSNSRSKIPGSSGLVRNRVAMLETTPGKKASPPTPVLRKSNIKKPAIRPTSLEKTPLLVMPVTERTVELSKPVCRKLEYLEGTTALGDERDDTNTDAPQGLHAKISNGLKTVAEDILIVGSIETEMQKDNNILVETENYGSYYDNTCDKRLIEKSESSPKVSPGSELQTSYTKAREDLRQTEKSSGKQGTSDVSCSSSAVGSPVEIAEELDAKSELHSPDESGLKAITPQSESSFEILESLSETIDLTIDEIKEDCETSISISDSRSTIIESKPNVKVESPVSAVSEGAVKPAVPPKPKNALTPTHSPAPHQDTPNSTEAHHTPPPDTPRSQTGTTEKQSISSPVDKKRHLGQMLASMKTSLESKSSMESSMESQKSLAAGNPMVESGELTSTLSGMCTPVLTSKGDMDQDFLIDDEISDQPGLLFAGPGLSSSFFGDDGIFDDLPTATPSHAALKAVMELERSRADSVDTTSSLGGDDLMLDFEDTKMAATGYEEEVLSPDASEIFSEWTAMMAEMGGSERCVSRDGSSCGGRTPRTRQGSLTETTSPDPRRPTVLRPPRQGGVCEVEGGGVYVDRTSYQYLRQEARALKTMLLQLRRIIQGADTINPFDSNMRNSLYLSLGSSGGSEVTGRGVGEKDSLGHTVTEISHENVDLRRQVVLLQQQLEEKDRTIRLLQQQLSQSLQLAPTSISTSTTTSNPETSGTLNAATQTDRSTRTTLMGLHASSFDDGSGPTVSSEMDGERCGRSRSTSLQGHSRLRQPRAASQPPAIIQPPLNPAHTHQSMGP